MNLIIWIFNRWGKVTSFLNLWVEMWSLFDIFDPFLWYSIYFYLWFSWLAEASFLGHHYPQDLISSLQSLLHCEQRFTVLLTFNCNMHTFLRLGWILAWNWKVFFSEMSNKPIHNSLSSQDLFNEVFRI